MKSLADANLLIWSTVALSKYVSTKEGYKRYGANDGPLF